MKSNLPSEQALGLLRDFTATEMFPSCLCLNFYPLIIPSLLSSVSLFLSTGIFPWDSKHAQVSPILGINTSSLCLHSSTISFLIFLIVQLLEQAIYMNYLYFLIFKIFLLLITIPLSLNYCYSKVSFYVINSNCISQYSWIQVTEKSVQAGLNQKEKEKKSYFHYCGYYHYYLAHLPKKVHWAKFKCSWTRVYCHFPDSASFCFGFTSWPVLCFMVAKGDKDF